MIEIFYKLFNIVIYFVICINYLVSNYENNEKNKIKNKSIKCHGYGYISEKYIVKVCILFHIL